MFSIFEWQSGRLLFSTWKISEGALIGAGVRIGVNMVRWIFEPRHDKPTMSVRPAKTQITLGIRPVWSESSQWTAKDPRFLHADSEDSDQTGRMPRLIFVFAGRTLSLLVLSCCGSFDHELIHSHEKNQIQIRWRRTRHLVRVYIVCLTIQEHLGDK